MKEIGTKLNGTDSGGELIEVLQSPSTSRGNGLSRSSSQVEGVDDMNFDHDSGFSYSTTSSINDCGEFSFSSPHRLLPDVYMSVVDLTYDYQLKGWSAIANFFP